jgi:hypothetical protein
MPEWVRYGSRFRAEVYFSRPLTRTVSTPVFLAKPSANVLLQFQAGKRLGLRKFLWATAFFHRLFD